jgi:hypothetical protein
MIVIVNPPTIIYIWCLGVFGSVVAVAFQNVFRSEIHQNNVFFIFLKSFLISAHQNDLKTPKRD